ncbi:hypothetical protein KYJ98_09285 [Mammaliicoccus lentus]|uniref:phage tail assembly chaperone G n=1 Tax=Mammaliicoccus lentus TaxID=42858 RepID=UPI001C4DDD4F|nr:hypothetical protein [Mammaliicoccus lentus]MBW0770509.1 hypothetical protein [Mammaliicoccus lentus]
MITITLEIEGKKKKFTKNKLTLGAMRRVAEMEKAVKELQGDEEQNALQIIDETCLTVVELFGNQFTFQELLDGLAMEDYEATLEKIFNDMNEPEKKTTAKRTTTKAQAK